MQQIKKHIGVVVSYTTTPTKMKNRIVNKSLHLDEAKKTFLFYIDCKIAILFLGFPQITIQHYNNNSGTKQSTMEQYQVVNF